LLCFALFALFVGQGSAARILRSGIWWWLVVLGGDNRQSGGPGRAMTRQWKKEKQSDFVNLSLVLTNAHYLTLIFHTLCRGGVLLSGVRTSFLI